MRNKIINKAKKARKIRFVFALISVGFLCFTIYRLSNEPISIACVWMANVLMHSFKAVDLHSRIRKIEAYQTLHELLNPDYQL